MNTKKTSPQKKQAPKKKVSMWFDDIMELIRGIIEILIEYL